MVKVRYKEVSPELQSLVKPDRDKKGRASLGNETHLGEYFYLSVDKLIPFKKQARQSFDDEDLRELASTIKKYGVRQPLSVVISSEEPDKYEIISGERRLRASILAGVDRIPCIIVDHHENIEEIALIENIQREDLHPIELANALTSLMKRNVYGELTEIANKLGVNKSKITETLKLTTLPQSVKEYLISKKLKSRALLRALLKCETEEEMLKMLGVKKLLNDSIKSRSRNVVHITTKAGNLSVIIDYKRLNESQRIDLKKKLQEIIDQI